MNPYYELLKPVSGSGSSVDENIGNVYKSILYQRGYGFDREVDYHATYGLGFADSLQGFIRLVAPMFKTGLKYLGSQAVNTAANIAQDVISGANVKEAAQKRVTHAAGEIFAKAPEVLVDAIKTANGKRSAVSINNSSEVKASSAPKRRRLQHRGRRRNLLVSYPALEKISKR